MGLIATRDKRDKLRLLYEDAKASDKRLLEVLMSALRACDNVAPNGTWLAGSGEAGGSVSMSLLQGMTPLDAKRLIGELVDLHEKVVAYIGDENAEDKVIVAQMLGVTSTTGPRLARVTSIKQDYTGLRYGSGLSLST